METNERIQKVNTMYLLGNIFIPIFAAIVINVFGALFLGRFGAVLGTAAMMGALLWWAVIGKSVYDKGKEKTLAELDKSGFTRNHTFNGDGCTVAVDINQGKVALLFRWNPGKVYIRPASALSRVHTEDGKTGVGITEGSARVRFCFVVEQIRVNVNTFTSNQRWPMDSEHILTGISKADMMVETLVAAGAQAGK
ncbi:MAG: hypothetical protein IJ716_13265 [Lachnospiraceae bacterium]|nr:hypothetical protein [Lachnospiraceae bacterium]